MHRVDEAAQGEGDAAHHGPVDLGENCDAHVCPCVRPVAAPCARWGARQIYRIEAGHGYPEGQAPVNVAFVTHCEGRVAAGTGRGLEEWFELLDAAGGRGMGHAEIVAFLGRRHALPPAWQQDVAQGYERACGIRAVHQGADGFVAVVRRSIRAPLDLIVQAWTDDFVSACWLPGHPLQVEAIVRRRSVRGAWRDGTRVEVALSQRGASCAVVHVRHGRLWSVYDVDRFRSFWRARLAALQSLCER